LAAVAGHPVGDVRPPLTTFPDLGDEGRSRVQRIEVLMSEIEQLMDVLDRT
jgi:4-hydroxy-tetrahydrodipicolinate synthase